MGREDEDMDEDEEQKEERVLPKPGDTSGLSDPVTLIQRGKKGV